LPTAALSGAFGASSRKGKAWNWTGTTRNWSAPCLPCWCAPPRASNCSPSWPGWRYFLAGSMCYLVDIYNPIATTPRIFKWFGAW